MGNLLTEMRAPGSEATRERVKSKLPEKDQTTVSEAAAVAVAASASDWEGGSGPKWYPGEAFNPPIALEVIKSRNALSGAGSDSLRFSCLQLIIRTLFGRERLALVRTEVLWRRIIDDPNAFPPEFWQLFLQSNLALGEKDRPVCVGTTRRCTLAAGTVRQWRPRLEETNVRRDTLG